MNIAGIITEYNPFHLGHRYHMKKVKELTGADKVLVVMSGNYVQRGEPAVMDKYIRARMALLEGADAVFELPVPFATGSAEYFAQAAVYMLSGLGAQTVCFGSECGDVNLLKKAAELLLNEPEEVSRRIKEACRCGKSYPAARQEALVSCLHLNQEEQELFRAPNDILGIEYVKAISQLDLPVTPVAIKRRGDYHARELEGTFSSATAIRGHLEEYMTSGDSPDWQSALWESIPEELIPFYGEALGCRCPITADDFSQGLMAVLQREDVNSLCSYLDITIEIARRILKYARLSPDVTFSELAAHVKSRQYTVTRIYRSLIHILLDIRSEEVEEYRKNGFFKYARLLGMRRSSGEMLRRMQDNSQFNIITKPADAPAGLSDIDKRIWECGIRASHLYEQTVRLKYQTPGINEYQRSFTII